VRLGLDQFWVLQYPEEYIDTSHEYSAGQQKSTKNTYDVFSFKMHKKHYFIFGKI